MVSAAGSEVPGVGPEMSHLPQREGQVEQECGLEDGAVYGADAMLDDRSGGSYHGSFNLQVCHDGD